MPILFDLDDTLLNHTAALRAGTEALHKRIDSPLRLDEFAAAWESALARQFDRYLGGELTFDQQRWERVREVVDSSLSDSAADQVFSTYREAYEAAWALFPDVEDALERLSGHRLGIVTNGQGQQQRRKLETTGLFAGFDCVVVSEEAGVTKPDPAIFLKACSQLQVTPHQAVYVGDRYEVDILGARRAGLGGIWLNRRQVASIEHAPPVINSLDELPDSLVRMEV